VGAKSDNNTTRGRRSERPMVEDSGEKERGCEMRRDE
jgi:hypothetical protein